MVYDLIIIGGGINGAGIAADAAGRGLSVLLIEQNEFGSGTSCKSSKLIHGGLRYLENYEFSLVKKALKERKVLFNIAPDLVKPLQFIIPNDKTIRSPLLVRLGLWIYDLFSIGSKMPKSRKLKFTEKHQLKAQYKTGFSYYDAQTDDQLLVKANINLAKKNNATALNFTRCEKININKQNKLWEISCNNQETYQGKILINATGPWLNLININLLPNINMKPIELVKGTHIIVNQFYPQHHAFLLQNKADNRVIFTIPYKSNTTLIGTTDIPYDGDPSDVTASEEEKEYLINIVNQYFKKQLLLTDIIDAWAGVRPLLAAEKNTPTKASKLSRDYQIEFESSAELPLLTIYGGKLTTYRKLSEQAVNMVAPLLNNTQPTWTKKAKL